MEQNKSSLNENRILIWGIIISIMAILLFLYNYPFHQSVDHTITAIIYIDGQASDKTTVSMKGEKTNYVLRKNERYDGSFDIVFYPGTNSKSVKADIRWDKVVGNWITYYSPGNFAVKLDGPYIEYISEDMTEFVLRDKETNIFIATSEELFDIYAMPYQQMYNKLK